MKTILEVMLTAVLGVVVIGGCVPAYEKYSTASGFPEVTISADKATVKNAIVSKMVGTGWELGQTPEFQITGTKTLSEMLHSKLKREFTLLDEGGKVRVIGKEGVVGGVEYRAEQNGMNKDVEKALLEVKVQLEKTTP